MKFRLVEDQFGRSDLEDNETDFWDEHDAKIDPRADNALSQLERKCINLMFPTTEDDRKIIADRLENNPTTSVVSRFFQILNYYAEEFNLKKVAISTLFGGPLSNNETAVNEFFDELSTNLKDIKAFVPYKNCFNLPKREREYVCRVVDGWFGDNFRRYFGNVLAKDTGVRALENSNRSLNQDDFDELFVVNGALKPSGFPNSDDTRTIYGMVEFLTELNDAELPGRHDKKKAQVDSDTFRDGLKKIKSNGKALDDDAIKEIETLADFM